MPQVLERLPVTHRSSAERILFVDDERRVLSSMRAMFRRHYDVLVAQSGADALTILREEEIDVIVSDQRMPEMTGVELLAEAKNVAPQATRILLTGYADLDAIEASINTSEVFRYLIKPCPPDELKSTIALAMHRAKLGDVDTSNVVPLPTRTRPAEAEPPLLTSVVDDTAASSPTTEQIAADTEVLVLSGDEGLLRGVDAAIDGSRIIHVTPLVRDALKILEEFDIGVVITDIATDPAAIADLNETLRSVTPDLVTMIASDRADAPSLIELINSGHLFRFLLKPIQPAQCGIWIESGAKRHADLRSHRAESGLSETSTMLFPSRRPDLMTRAMGWLRRSAARWRARR